MCFYRVLFHSVHACDRCSCGMRNPCHEVSRIHSTRSLGHAGGSVTRQTPCRLGFATPPQMLADLGSNLY